MISLILVIMAFFMGFFYREVREKLIELTEKLEKVEPKVGATDASYGPVFQTANQPGDIGLVEPKTAQRLEWEEQERLRKMQLGPK